MIYGIGTDIEKISRMKKIYYKNPSLVINKVLTLEEQEKFKKINIEKKKVEWLTGRFSAKESLAKAIGLGFGKNFSFHDGAILSDKNGKPVFIISNKLQELLPKNVNIFVSISHSIEYVTTLVVIEHN
ncbi:holo-ACP synthase [Staphylococcus hominis]|uniref:holo-ACP synthase n=1 Tax=Staphylococcus hominis TaxID=1290 RepID=UPI003D02A407